MGEVYLLQPPGAGPMAPAAGYGQGQVAVEADDADEDDQLVDLGQKAGELAGALIAMAAVAKELETQSHLIHLNYECSNFLAVHEFLKGRYEAHLEQFDALAEFVRSMDYLMPICRCGLESAASPEFKHVESREPKAMLMTYFQNLEAFGMAAKELERLAGECRAVDVQNYAAELVGDSFKAAWFCKATLRNG